MKKFFGHMRKNIFYVSLIAGMIALVSMVALYNMKTKTKEDKAIDLSQKTEEATIEEAISDGDKTSEEAKGISDEVADNTEGSTTEDKSQEVTAEAEDEKAEEMTYDGSSISWPISGNVIIPYSMDTTVYYTTLKEYKCNPGMVMEAQEGDKVYSAYKSKVTELISDPVYGNMLKCSLGSGYEIVYGQLGDIDVAVGDIISTGQEIGTVSAPTKYFNEEGANLYFAITKDGEPVDPLMLIN